MNRSTLDSITVSVDDNEKHLTVDPVTVSDDNNKKNSTVDLVTVSIDENKKHTTGDSVTIAFSLAGGIVFLLFVFLATCNAQRWMIKRAARRRRVCTFVCIFFLHFIS